MQSGLLYMIIILSSTLIAMVTAACVYFKSVCMVCMALQACVEPSSKPTMHMMTPRELVLVMPKQQ